MKRLSFNPIPGAVGKLVSEIELVISHKDPKALNKIKKILTAKNKSAAFQYKKAKESLGFNEAKLKTLEALNTPKDADSWAKTEIKIQNAKKLIAELEHKIYEIYFAENPNGSISVPAGLWYLCETIEGSAHCNTELQPYKLPGLRPYQSEALDALYKYNRCTIELATGLGKSKIIYSLAISGVKAGKRVMIVVPTEYLVGQIYRELKELHPNTAALGGDFKHPKLGWDILVTTINSAPKYADLATMISLDESHHASASTWQELLSTATNATHVYNLTATAFRSDGLDIAIHAFGGPIVYARDAKWGLDNGWLSPLKVVQVRIRPRYPSGHVIRLPDNMPMQRAYKTLMSASNVQAFIREKLNVALSKGRRIMCIFRTVKFAEVFRKFCGNTPKFQVAHADKTLSKSPKLPLKQFNDNLTNLLVACDKLVSEGIDIPSANLLVCATQHTSDITTLQLLGRVLRKSEGKESATCLDIVVMGYSQFERAGKARLAIYKYLCDDVVEIEV